MDKLDGEIVDNPGLGEIDGMKKSTQDESGEQGEGESQNASLSRFKRLLHLAKAFLPTGTQEPDTGYTGPFSYSVEFHTFIIGLSVGVTASTTGELQRAFGLLSLIFGSGRINQQASEEVTEQLTKEPAYFVIALVIGYAIPYVLNGRLLKLLGG